MLVNPGGPGGPGLGLSAIGALVPAHAGDAYDWIGFDPRGVGASKPALSCDSTYAGYNRPPYVPNTAALEATWRHRTEGYAAACAASGGSLLDHLKTTDTVADMESIRQALGVSQINFYGFSYGTYIGEVYATLHPDRVRRMILDGVVDPGRVWYDSNLDQDVAFDRNMQIYFGWMAKYDSVYHLGRTTAAVRRLFDRTGKALAKKPAGGTIGPDELTDVFLQAGYYVFGWTNVATAFAAYVHKQDVAPAEGAVRPVEHPGPRLGQRVRGLPRRAVHRRAVAGGLVDLAGRQLADQQEGAVRDVAQRLVQRAVPGLGGQGRHPGRGRRGQGAADPADQ